MGGEFDTIENKPMQCPATPRSILIAGEIEVCIEPPNCEEWQECYDGNKKIDCCKTELIPVADYCEDKIIRIGR
jgi:hypothetical protein